MLGFSACRASYLLCFVALSSYSDTIPGLLNIYWLTAAAAAAIVAWVVYFFELKILYNKIWMCAGIFSLGGLLIMFSGDRFGSIFLFGVGAMSAGLGSVLLYILWGVKLSRLSSQEIIFYVVFNLAIAAGIVFVVNLFGDIAPVSAFVMALISLFLLENPLVMQKGFGGADRSNFEYPKQGALPIRSIINLCVMTVIFTSCYHIAAMTFTSTTIRNRDIEGIIISGLSLLIIALTPYVRLITIFRSIVPVIVASYLFFDLLPSNVADLCVIIGGSGFRLSWIFIWIALVNMAHVHFGARWLIICVGIGSMFAGRVLSLLVTYLFVTAQLNDFTLAIYLIVIIIVVAVMVVLPNALNFNGREGQHISVKESFANRTEGKCLYLSGEYNLTKRESEVFCLLVMGRSQEIIAEKLGISKGTVHVHITHIYQKLGVHSQQEVISMVEENKDVLQT